MKKFIDFINEDVDKKMTAENGSSLRTSIIKHHGGTAVPSFGSNPYADYKRTELEMQKEKTDDLKKHLESYGWKSHTRNLHDIAIKNGIFHMDHPTNSNVHLSVSPYKDTAHNHKAHVTIYSPKKAKRSSLPYYD